MPRKRQLTELDLIDMLPEDQPCSEDAEYLSAKRYLENERKFKQYRRKRIVEQVLELRAKK